MFFSECVCGQARKSPEKPLPYKRVVAVGIVTYRNHGSCTDFVAFVTSGDFFEGLEPRETPDGRKFYKDSKQVTEFPEAVTIELQALMRDCTRVPILPVNTATAKDFMSTLNFDLQWKRELEQRSAVFSTAVSSPDSHVWSEGEPPYWTFDLEVKTKGVPLTDHLVVEVHSENRQLVARLALHL